MFDLNESFGKVEGGHAKALQWFREHTGRTVTWVEIKDHADKGARLVTQAKGIYKPHYTDYALSVRQTIDSPYADKEVERRADGSWVYPYFQENADPNQRDAEATNRGLMHCMTDSVPIGVLLQVKPKPGVEYTVLGLAMVKEWDNGYFILEGFSDQGSLPPKGASDAAYDRAVATIASSPFENFEPANVADLRKRQLAEVIRRRGQAKFRTALIAAYGGKCAITGCDAVEALEAAHISPYKGDQSHHPQNGLLLRSDLHSLFDLGLLAIDPATLTVVVSPKLAGTSYAVFAGQAIAAPIDESLKPSAIALAHHLNWTGIKDG